MYIYIYIMKIELWKKHNELDHTWSKLPKRGLFQKKTWWRQTDKPWNLIKLGDLLSSAQSTFSSIEKPPGAIPVGPRALWPVLHLRLQIQTFLLVDSSWWPVPQLHDYLWLPTQAESNLCEIFMFGGRGMIDIDETYWNTTFTTCFRSQGPC